MFKPENAPKPNVKIKGQRPADGGEPGGSDDAGVALAKQLANGNVAAPESAAHRAENIYFGANK